MMAPREQTSAYNELSLPQRDRYEVSICSFLPAELAVPADIRLYEGDGTVAGFRRALKRALAAEPDIVHAHSVHTAGLYLVAGSSGRGTGPASVFTVHSSFGNENLKLYHRAALLPILASYDRTVCVSRASMASLPALYRLAVGDRLRVVPNGVDLDRVDGARPDGAGRSRNSIASVGRLIAIKDPLTVVRAVAKLGREDVDLVFIGEGPLRRSVTDLASAEGIADRVSLTGLVSRDEVYRRLWSAGVFISASKGEGLPVSALEGLACGCAAVLSDIPPHREIAEGAGWLPLVPLGDVGEMARTLDRILALSSEQRTELERSGRVHVQERFGLAAMLAAYSEVYSQAIQSAGPSSKGAE
jgi:glycosyltransferase involved in cell wall biosynthesis